MSRGDRPRPTRERTAEERERDREQREHRRAGLPVASEPAPPATAAPPRLPIEQQPPPALPPEIPPAVELVPPREPAATPELAAPEVSPAVEIAPAAEIPPVVYEQSPQLVPPPATPTTGLQPPPALPPELGGSRPLQARRRSRRSLIARVLAVVALAAVIAAVGLLAHSLLRSGHTTPVAAVQEVKVLISEGKTRAQIAEIAAKDHLIGSYGAASKHSPLLNPAHYGAPAHTDSLEGFLFPATYDMDVGAPASRLVEDQVIAFRENFGASEVQRARDLHITPYQLLTVASMVEREAQIPSDRSKIAAVIYNRLHDGSPLGIDASIYYAVELQKGIATYTHELTEADLHIDSPYNTRTHTGLPPTPISNPGDASIHAAAYPAHVSYLYYVAGADGCGEQVFSNTLAEFEVNVAAYQAALRKNGGHPPSCKHK